MESDITKLEAEVLHLSQLSRDLLDDAATEIEVDLEMCWYDHGELPDYPRNPYDEFLWFAARIANSSSGCPEYSVLCELTHRQTYLAAAWNYLTIVRTLTNAAVQGSSDSALADVKDSLRDATLRLIDDVNSRPYALHHCRMRDEPMGEYIGLH